MASDLPTGRNVPREKTDRATAARSFLVVQRFAYKVAFFVAIAGGAAALGHGFVKHLASFALLSAVVSIVLAQSQRLQMRSPFYTSFDEAAWFLLLFFIARANA